MTMKKTNAFSEFVVFFVCRAKKKRKMIAYRMKIWSTIEGKEEGEGEKNVVLFDNLTEDKTKSGKKVALGRRVGRGSEPNERRISVERGEFGTRRRGGKNFDDESSLGLW